MRGIYIKNIERFESIRPDEIMTFKHKIDRPLHISVGETIYVRETRFMPEREARIFMQVIESIKTDKEYIIIAKML